MSQRVHANLHVPGRKQHTEKLWKSLEEMIDSARSTFLPSASRGSSDMAMRRRSAGPHSFNACIASTPCNIKDGERAW